MKLKYFCPLILAVFFIFSSCATPQSSAPEQRGEDAADRDTAPETNFVPEEPAATTSETPAPTAAVPVEATTAEATTEYTGEILTSITDIADWHKLPPEISQQAHYRDNIQIFLSGNTSQKAREEGKGDLYDGYDSLVFGDYTIRAIEENDKLASYLVTVDFEITESSMELLPAGKYTYVYSDYLGALIPVDKALYAEDDPGTAAYTTVMHYLRTIGTKYLTNEAYQALTGDEIYWTNIVIIEYLSAITGKNELTLDEVTGGADKYLGIKQLRDIDRIPKWGEHDTYAPGAHGGVTVGHKYAGEREENGNTIVTLEFFADVADTIRSDTVEFTVKPVDSVYTVAAEKVVSDTLHAPYYHIT